MECDEDFGVELELGGHFDLEIGGMVEMAAGLEQLLDRDLLRDDIVDVGEEAVFLAGIELDGAEDVGELKAVDDDAGIVGVGAGADDVHAPCGQDAGHVGKEARAVAGDHGEVEELAVGAQIELDVVFVEIERHLEVIANLLGQAGLQVALRQAFEKLLERVVLRRREPWSGCG